MKSNSHEIAHAISIKREQPPSMHAKKKESPIKNYSLKRDVGLRTKHEMERVADTWKRII